MSPRGRGAILALGYFMAWSATWPAILADLQHADPCYTAHAMFRQELGAAMGLALIPPVWFATPFVTGFYEQGMQYGPRQDCGFQ